MCVSHFDKKFSFKIRIIAIIISLSSMDFNAWIGTLLTSKSLTFNIGAHFADNDYIFFFISIYAETFTSIFPLRKNSCV